MKAGSLYELKLSNRSDQLGLKIKFCSRFVSNPLNLSLLIVQQVDL